MVNVEDFCEGRQRFVSAKAAHKESEHVYQCNLCHGWHTGFKRDKKKAKFHHNDYQEL